MGALILWSVGPSGVAAAPARGQARPHVPTSSSRAKPAKAPVVHFGSAAVQPGRPRLSRPAAASRLAAPSNGSMAVNGDGWVGVGPKPIQGVGTFGASVGTYGATSGRVTALAAGGGAVYAGTAGGGVWKTTDGGSTWSPTTDDQVSLAIGGLAIDPQNPQAIYAATGEDNRCADCQYGQGFLKSANAGQTWTIGGQTGLLTGPVSVSGSRIFVGTNNGLYWSVDSGNSWGPNAGFDQLTPSGTVDAVISDPVATPGRVWVSVNEGCQGSGFIAASSDTGATWSIQARMSDFAGLPPIERIAMAGGPGGVLYAALAACSSTTPKYSLGQFVAILKSTDSGAHWAVIKPTAANHLSDYFSNGPGIYQGDYDNVVAVNPANTQQAVFGGVTMMATSDGGATFADIAEPYNGGPVHPDFHAALYSGTTLFVGNDGGVYSTSAASPGTSWSNLNATLAVTTFYAGAALDANHIVGGAQDEGTSGLLPGGPTPPAWRELIGSDGGNVSLDPTPGSTAMYAETPYGGIYKGSTTFNDASNWQLASPCSISTDRACNELVDFTAPFAVNWSTTPPTVFTATNGVYRSLSGGLPAGPGGWSPISGDLTTGTSINANGDWITAMAFQAPNTLVVGSYGGRVQISQNAMASTPTWTDLTSGLPTFGPNLYTGRPWITSLAIAGGVVWVTIGSAGGYQRVARTAVPPSPTNWFFVDGSLPPGPINSIALDPSSPETVYVGTDTGAFICGDCSHAQSGGVIPWALMGSGMPNAQIDALTMQQDGAAIVAFTHGRGAYSLRHRTAFSANPASLDFGYGTVGTSGPSTAVMITATGVTASTAVSATVSGPNASDFSVQTGNFFTPNCQGMVRLLPESTCQLVLNFTPSAETTRTATLRVADAQGGTLDIPLTGIGSHPVVGLSPASLTFSSVNVGVRSAAQRVTVSNTGKGPLTVSRVTTSGDFDQSNTCSAVVPGGGSCWIDVFFWPTARGTRTGTLSIVDDAAGSPHTVSLSGFGTQPVVSLSTASLSFPDTPFPLSVAGPTLPVTITNTGDGLLTITRADSSLADFATTSYSPDACYTGTVPPNQSCTLNVRFMPTALGARTGTLTISDDANPKQQTIALSGKGIPAPFAQRDPDQLNFGIVNIGTSPTKSVTLTNTGTAALTNLSITIFATLTNQPSEYFVQDNTCLGSLAVNQACAITVAFRPTRTGGNYGELHINDDAANSPQIVSLLGQGGDVHVALQPSTLTFGSQVVSGTSPVQTVQLTKSGNGNLVITSIKSSTPDFTVLGGSCLSGDVNQGCSQYIAFTPTKTGILSGSILVNDNATDGTSPQIISVSGTGTPGPIVSLSPSSLAFSFPPQSPGTISTPKSITLTNTGQQALNVSSVGFAQGGGYFTETNTCAAPIAVGSTCTVSVSFAPQSFGDASNYLIITDNAANSPQTVALTGTSNLAMSSGPGVSSWGPGRLDVFALGPDGALWHKYYDSAVGWQGWSTLGAPSSVSLASDPAAVSWSKGRIDVFLRGSDNALWHKYYDVALGGWSGWYPHAGTTLTSAPSAASWGYGRLDIFAKGSANDLQHIFYSSTTGWSTWYSHSPAGMLTSGPGAVSWGYGRIDVFARGAAGDLEHIYYDVSLNGWSGWFSHGGTLQGAPHASSWGRGRLDIFVRASDSNLQHIFYDSSQRGWNPWEPQQAGYPLYADPTAVSWGIGRIDVFSRDQTNVLLHIYFGAGSWSGWYLG